MIQNKYICIYISDYIFIVLFLWKRCECQILIFKLYKFLYIDLISSTGGHYK